MRIKVALRNLYISQAIILVFLLFAYLSCFPYSFTQLGGFYKTAWTLILVDLVLGPLLVFLIYKENKNYLTFDINVLLSIQLIALIFGAYSLFLKHPAYAVFSVNGFILTNVSDIYPNPSRSELAKDHFFSSPKLVIAHLPKDIKERNDLIIDIVLNSQPDIASRPKYFSPLNQHIEAILDKGIKIEHLDLDPQSEKKLNLFTKKHRDKYQNFAFFPLRGNNKKNVIWVFDKHTLEPIDILDIDPWKFKLAVN